MKSLLNDGNRHVKSYPIMFNGINRNTLIDDTDWKETDNIDTTEVPMLSPRGSMKLIKKYKDVLGYKGYDDIEFIIYKKNDTPTLDIIINNGYKRNVAGTQKLKNNNIDRYQMLLMDRRLLIFPSCETVVLNYKEDKVHGEVIGFNDYEDFSKTGGNKNGLNAISYACEYKNRIFIVDENDNIMCSAFDNYKVWNKFKGILSDNWATDVFSPGKFKNIFVYRDQVMAMKNNVTYEIFGDNPSNYVLQEAFKMGVVNVDCACEVAGKLLFVDESGVYMYAGGTPRRLSYKLNETYKDARCFSDNRKFYLSLDNGSKMRTYVFDNELSIWSGYSDKFFEYYGAVVVDGNKKIRAITRTGELYEFDSGDERVSWSAVSKLYDDKTFQKKKLRRIKLRCHLENGAIVRYYVSIDGKPYELKGIVKKNFDEYRVQDDFISYISVPRADTVQLKIEGEGKAKVYGEREMSFRSDR